MEETLKLTGTQESTYLPVEKLSGGQRQRYQITIVLTQRVPYILLDELTTWLDLHYQVGILELSRDLTRHYGHTVVVVLYDPNFAVNHGDTLIFLRQGKVVHVLNEGRHYTPELVKATFDVDVHVSINLLTGKPYFIPFHGIEKV